MVLQDYALKDKRLKVINQENAGQSAARNRGVCEAKAPYIAFVDGDDVCSPYYLETLFSHAEKNVMVCGRNYVISEKDSKSIEWEEAFQAEKLDLGEAIESILYNEIEEGPYCKLIPRSFLLNSPFPEGCLYEDMSVIGNLIIQATEVYLVKTPIYGYVMHDGSTINSKTCSIKKVNDYELALRSLCNVVAVHFEGMENGLRYRIALSYLRMRPLCQSVFDDLKSATRIEAAHGEYICAELRYLLFDPRVPRKDKARFALRVFTPRLYDFLMSAYERHVKGIAR